MRRLATTILVGALALVGFAGSASALSVLPDPIPLIEGSDGSRGRFKVLSVEPSRLMLQLSEVEGQPAGVKIVVIGADQQPRTPSHTGTWFGPDVNVIDGFVENDAAGFVFADFVVRMQTDPFFIEFEDLLQVGDQIIFNIVSATNRVVGSTNTTIVPEPASAALLWMGLGGLALAGRRRSLLAV